MPVCPLSVLIRLEECQPLLRMMQATSFPSKIQRPWQKRLFFYVAIQKKEHGGVPWLATRSEPVTICQLREKKFFVSLTNIPPSRTANRMSRDDPCRGRLMFCQSLRCRSLYLTTTTRCTFGSDWIL